MNGAVRRLTLQLLLAVEFSGATAFTVLPQQSSLISRVLLNASPEAIASTYQKTTSVVVPTLVKPPSDSLVDSMSVPGGAPGSLNLGDSTSTVISSINEAATQATDAARKAAEAASSIAQSSNAMFAAPNPASGKTLTLYEYVLSGGSAVSDGEGSSRLANAQDKFEIIKNNFHVFLRDLNVPDGDGIGAGLKQAVESGSASTSAKFASGSGAGVAALRDQIQAVSSSLNLGPNTAWYAAGAALFIALGQRGAGKAEARSEFEAELTNAKKKADEAAGAAALAAKGAAIAKEVATQMEAESDSDGKSANIMLENSRLRQMAVETEMMKDDCKKLKQENERLRAQLESLMGGNVPSEKSDNDSIIKMPKQKVVERDPEENEKILEIIKEVEAANKKGKKGKPKATTATKKVAPTTKKAAKPAATKAVSKAATKVAMKETPPPNAATKKTTKAASSSSKLEAAPAKRAKKGAGGRKKDWSQLSDSTLKRKTIAQLTAYLSEKGAKSDGMKKSELISLVKEL